MKLVKPSYNIIEAVGSARELEYCARVAYKSEDRISEDSDIKMINHLITSGHHSVLEHSMLQVKFICDRGVSHELVRHRLASFTQESTRYCNYKDNVTFVIPPWVSIEPGSYSINPGNSKPDFEWCRSLLQAEYSYQELLLADWSPQQARSVLPNSLKTKLIMTANYREWRHIFKLRTSSKAHPQMREIMIPLLQEVKHLIPIIFDDIKED